MIDDRYKIISATWFDKPLISVYPELKKFRFEPVNNIKCGVDIIPTENHGGIIELDTMLDVKRLIKAVDNNRLIFEDREKDPPDVVPEHIIVIYDGYIE